MFVATARQWRQQVQKLQKELIDGDFTDMGRAKREAFLCPGKLRKNHGRLKVDGGWFAWNICEKMQRVGVLEQDCVSWWIIDI